MPSRKTDAPPAEPVRQVQLAENRKAHFDYQIERRLEAGIALRGTEIKSLRAGHANLRDGYARVENGEVWLRNVHIAPWANSAQDNHDPLRPRKLLLHKDEIGLLVGTIAQKGYTLVPLRVYLGQRSQLSDLQRQTSQLEHRTAELTAQARQLQDPRYLERIARECLGMVRPGEIRFIVVPEGGRPAPPNC